MRALPLAVLLALVAGAATAADVPVVADVAVVATSGGGSVVRIRSTAPQAFDPVPTGDAWRYEVVLHGARLAGDVVVGPADFGTIEVREATDGVHVRLGLAGRGTAARARQGNDASIVELVVAPAP